MNCNVLAVWGDYCAAGSELRVHENTSSVASGCLRLLSEAPDPVAHFVRSVPDFRGLLLVVRSCSCSQVKCKRSVGGCFLSHFVHPKFRQISTTAAPQTRGVGLSVENLQAAILKRITSSVDETLFLDGHRLSAGTK